MEHEIEFLYFEGCPHAEEAWELLRDVHAAIGKGFSLRRVKVSTPEEAVRLGFMGSPSIRVDGRDIENRSGAPSGLTCRMYAGYGGVPPRWMIEAAILRATRPKGFLFMCVANSARSQMAEGIAKKLAAPEVVVFSAGSSPSQVNPLAIEVMREIGIDISNQRSKSVGDIPERLVEAVITLCKEEVCPAWLSPAYKLHWPLDDPSAAPPDERLEAFRRVRDELKRRLELLFS